jgi:hypothetical protein
VSELDEFFAGLDGGAALAVDADLRVELTTASGTAGTALITGHGPRLRVQADRPEALLAAVDRAGAGRVAELLAATGITVTVDGPDGPLAVLGAGTSSRFGRLVTGSSRVAPVPRGALRLARSSRPVRLASLAVPAVLAVLAAVRWLRRGTVGSTS